MSSISEAPSFGRWDDLPDELLSDILGNLATRTVLLKEASMVSRSWRAASLKYLFTSTALWFNQDFQDFKMLLDQHPELAYYIERFAWDTSLQTLKRTNFETMEADIDDLDLINPPDVPLPAFPNVTHLRWATSTKQPLHVNSKVTLFMSSFPSLTSLQISGAFPNVANFEQFLFLCGSGLKDLSIEYVDMLDVDWEYVAMDAPAAQYSLAKLESLKLENLLDDSFWISQRLFWFDNYLPRRLKKLTLIGDCSGEQTTEELLDTFADTLEELTFHPPLDANELRDTPHPVKSLKSLQSITFDCIFLGENCSVLMCVMWITLVLVHISAPALTTIHFGFRAEEPNDVLDLVNEEVDWEDVTSQIKEHFPSLKKVVFHFDTYYKFEEKFTRDFEIIMKTGYSDFDGKLVFEWEELFPDLELNENLKVEGDEEGAIGAEGTRWMPSFDVKRCPNSEPKFSVKIQQAPKAPDLSFVHDLI